jgi:hypothetical protein
MSSTEVTGREHHANQHTGGHQDSSRDASSERSDSPAHCLMPATCTLVGLVTGIVVSMDPVSASAAVAVHDEALPPSVGLAPEPPPPRA